MYYTFCFMRGSVSHMNLKSVLFWCRFEKGAEGFWFCSHLIFSISSSELQKIIHNFAFLNIDKVLPQTS